MNAFRHIDPGTGMFIEDVILEAPPVKETGRTGSGVRRSACPARILVASLEWIYLGRRPDGGGDCGDQGAGTTRRSDAG